ncbi:hypothetical protein TSUD_19900 [Trifolium subterraneum]|uniref:Peptidase C1A papain C-terminal domain-containing protein n=1 Tax=Trifolium subterraneum TaxID=3900 RepID=A0A2Z6NEE2_TRISU|nr:hypothetical protein TSUD_19900 [Trifolium subterraneum]
MSFYIDLRDTGYLNPVKDQAIGECCYAFVVCEAIEYLHHKEGGNRALLSPQDLYNNLAFNPNVIVQDHGQALNQTLNWIIHNGCVLESSCPYTGILQPPTPLWEREVRLRIGTSIPIKLENIETYIRRRREPVMVPLDWIGEMAYLGDEDEIYTGPEDVTAFERPDKHALLIVGFGPDYWLVYSRTSPW